MVEVREFDVADAERYVDVLEAASAALANFDVASAAKVLQPIAGEVWIGKLSSAGKAGPGGGAAGARVKNDALRAQTFIRDGFRCTHCGGRAIPRNILVAIHDLFPADIAYDTHYGRGKVHPIFWALAPEADHVLAHSRGGANEIDNLTTLHAACNTRKSDSLIADMPTLPRTTSTDRWDGLISYYPSLIAAGAGTSRPDYHRRWSRLFESLGTSTSR